MVNLELTEEAKKRIEIAKALVDAFQKKDTFISLKENEKLHVVMLKEDKFNKDPTYFEVWKFKKGIFPNLRKEGKPKTYLFRVKIDDKAKKIVIMEPHLSLKDMIYAIMKEMETIPAELRMDMELRGWRIIYK